MMTFVAVFHIIIAFVLIGLVLVQDSKGGGLGIGGAGSNSLLGAAGAQTLASKMTRFTAVLFAVTCISLTVMTAQSSRSVIDGAVLPKAAPAATAPVAPESSTPAAAAATTTPPAVAEQKAAPTATQTPAPAEKPAGTH